MIFPNWSLISTSLPDVFVTVTVLSDVYKKSGIIICPFTFVVYVTVFTTTSVVYVAPPLEVLEFCLINPVTSNVSPETPCPVDLSTACINTFPVSSETCRLIFNSYTTP